MDDGPGHLSALVGDGGYTHSRRATSTCAAEMQSLLDACPRALVLRGFGGLHISNTQWAANEDQILSYFIKRLGFCIQALESSTSLR